MALNSKALVGKTQASDHLAWLPILAGAAHRASMSHGGAMAALSAQLFAKQLQHLQTSHRALVGLLDWWLVALGQDTAVGAAWHVEEQVGHPVLGPALAGLLKEMGPGMLPELAKPILRARVKAELEHFLNNPPKLKKAPGSQLWSEARTDARAVLAALDRGEPIPTVSILELTPEEFASQKRDTRQLQTQLKVWNAMAKHSGYIQDKLRALIKLNQAAPTPAIDSLPTGWRRWAEQQEESELLSEVLDQIDATLAGRDWSPSGPLRPSSAYDALAVLEAQGDEERVLALAPAQEAADACGRPLAPWASATHQEVTKLRAELRALLEQVQELGLEEAAAIEEALLELDSLRIAEARSWRSLAEEAISLAQTDKAQGKQTRELAQWVALLESLDVDTAQLRERARPLADRHAQARAEVARLRGVMRARLEQLSGEWVPRPQVPTHHEQVAQAREALEQDELLQTRGLLDAADQQVEAWVSQAQARLMPELQEISEKLQRGSLRASERLAVEALVGRVQALAEAELPYESLLTAAQRLVLAAQVKALHGLDMLFEVGQPQGMMTHARVRPVAWLDSGVPIDAGRVSAQSHLRDRDLNGFGRGELFVATLKASWCDERSDELRIDRHPSALNEGQWVDVVPCAGDRPLEADFARYPGRLAMSGVFFVRSQTHLVGPYAIDDEAQAVPLDPRGLVVRVPNSVPLGELQTPGGRTLLPEAPSLDTLLALEGAEVLDSQDAASTARWLAGLLGAVSEQAHEELARGIGLLQVNEQGLPEAVVQQRIERLSALLETAQALWDERERAATTYLATDDGKRRVAHLARQLAEDQVHSVERELAQRREEAEDELEGLRAQIAQAQVQVAEGEASLDLALAARRAELESLEELADDKRLRLLAELGGSRAPVALDESPLRGVRRGSVAVSSLKDAHSRVMLGLKGWQDLKVANLMSTLLTSRWTLIAGPPGVGKSTFARSLLTRLGYGPATPSYLELAVRRDWHDDAALFGFWHPERGAWMGSSEGLLEQLLCAQEAWAAGDGALYPCLMEELNLAPPEHYMARLLSGFEAREPRMALYGRSLNPQNAERYPAQLSLSPMLRVVATVNVDDTVERLSPRFLSRAAVLRVEPSLAMLRAAAPAAQVPERPLCFKTLVEGLPQPQPLPERMMKLAEWLHDRRVSGAPTPRAIRGIEACLPVAGALMPEQVAQDYQVLQRILPSLRGVGERYRLILDELGVQLKHRGWELSAARCERVRERGEELGDFYDFFHN